MRWRKRGGFFALLSVSLFALWWGAGVPRAQRWLKSKLESVLSQALGRPVRSDAVRLSPFLLHFSVENLRVGDPDAPLFACRRWTFYTAVTEETPWSWLFFSLGRSDVEVPVVRWTSTGGPLVWPADLWSRLPRHSIHCIHGALLWDRVGESPIRLADVAGGVDLAADQWTWNLRGVGDPGAWAVSGVLKNGGGGLSVGTARVLLESLPAEFLTRALPPAVGRWTGSGRVLVRARFEARAGTGGTDKAGRVALTDWDVEAEAREARWWPRIPGGGGAVETRGIPVSFQARMDRGRLSVGRLELWRTLTLTGTVLRPWERDQRTVDFSFESGGLDLADVKAGAGGLWRNLPLGGRLGVSGRWAGPWVHPKIDGTAALDQGTLAGVSLPPLRVEARWADGRFGGRAAICGGTISLEAPAPSTGVAVSSWTAVAENVDLGVWAGANGWPEVGGRASGQFVFGRRSEAVSGGWPVQGEGAWAVENFRWGAHHRAETVSGHLSLREDGFRALGDGGRFVAAVDVSSGGWRIDRLAYAAPEGFSFEGNGRLTGDPAAWDLRARLEAFPLRDVPPILRRFPEVVGTLSADGALTGPLNEPRFEGGVRLQGVRWRPGGAVHAADMEFHGSRRHLRLPRLSWDDTVTADGAWIPERGWQLSATFNKTDAARAFDFWSGAGFLSGTVEGQLSLSGAPGAPLDETRGWGNLQWTDGRWGPVEFRRATGVFFLDHSKILLDGLDLRQSSGAFHADGEWTREAPARWAWRANLRAADFRAAGAWDGSAVVSGALDRGRWTGTAISPGLSWDGIGLGEIRAGFHADRSGGSVAPFQSGAGLRGELRWERAGGFLNGWASLDNARWAELLPVGVRSPLLRRSDVVPGRGRALARFSGTWADPRVELQGSVNGAQWKSVGVDIEATAAWSDHRLSVSKASVRLGSGGGATARGEVVFSTTGAPPAAQWSADFNDLRLGPVLTAVVPDNLWDGRATGRVEGRGTMDDPEVQFRASGNLQRGETIEWTIGADCVHRVWTVRQADFGTPEGSLKIRPGGTLAPGPSGGERAQFVADARNIHAGPLTFFGAVAVDGAWRGDPQEISARLTARSLWVNQQWVDRDLAQIRWTPGNLEFEPLSGEAPYLTGRMDLADWPQTRLEDLTLWEGSVRRLWMSGEVGPRRWDFDLRAVGMEAETLVAIANLDWPVTGRWNARVRGRGTPADPGLDAEIRGRDGRLGPVPYDRLEADVAWSGSTVTVRDLRVARSNGYLLTGEAHGPAAGDPSGGGDVGAHLRLQDGELKILQDMWPTCKKARGAFSGELNVESKNGGLRSAGYFEIRDGQLTNRAYARHVKDLGVRLLLVDDRLMVESGAARIGAGRAVLRGDVLLPRDAPPVYNLWLETLGDRGVEVEVPQLSVPPGPVFSRLPVFQESLKGVSRGEPIFVLHATGPQGRHVITADVTLNNSQFTYPPAKGAFHRVPGPRFWRDFWREAAWDVRFHTGKDTWYRNEYVNVEIDGNLALAGRPGAWLANGKIGARQGVINYLGQNFIVTQGAFEVETDTRPGLTHGVYPYISGVAEKTVAGVDARGFANDDVVTMVVDRARLGEIQPRFISRNSPGLKSDRVAMRALGLSGEDQLSQSDRDQLFRAGLVQLVGASAAPLATRLAQNFGIYMINTIYEPPETTESASPLSPTQSPSATAAPARDLATYLRGAGASARIRLTDRLFGVYKVKLDEAQNQFYFRDEIELVYRVAKSLHLRASTELDSEKLLGQPPNRRIALENQWRFGLPRRQSIPKEPPP
ncbi:MAG: translocation/assembly module TamB domain-containing protein [Elusimicrobia bacterium]|nr:translocation/assembly module TamB domain-containing protein [Elusimicrobiota bacterium]